MTGFGHLIMGGMLSMAVVSATPDLSLGQAIGAVFFGVTASILPDIDAENSTIKVAVNSGYKPVLLRYLFGTRYRKGLVAGLIYELLAVIEISVRALLVLLMDVVHLIFGHRGVTHYLVTAVVLFLGFYIVSILASITTVYAVTFFLGYLSHLFGDAATTSGLYFLKPFYHGRLYSLPKVLRITPGTVLTIKELLVVGIVALFCFLIIYS